ncbi:hypothetical protein BD770DRAFT_390057 [Pilaira anomala]|nr:hypothetical protein BD770DRAFT_390057 [Pilaira anomala]
MYHCIKLFLAEYFRLIDQTERDLLRRVWSYVDTVFDFSTLKCRSREGRNQDRCQSFSTAFIILKNRLQ